MHAVAAIVDAPSNSEFNLLTPEQSSGHCHSKAQLIINDHITDAHFLGVKTASACLRRIRYGSIAEVERRHRAQTQSPEGA
jgi:hypothetical protein